MGEMIPCLSSSGNIPVLKEFSIIVDSTGVRWLAIDLKISNGRESKGDEYLAV